MRGIDISREYWLQCGKPVFEREFPQLMEYIAVGLVGSGSECFGFDDDISRDHDFGPGFCVFLPPEDIVDRRSAFLLERAYDKLPKEFLGLKKEAMNPAGGNRLGVFRTSEWYEQKTGFAAAPEDWRAFMSLPDYALAEVINGDIFYDGLGEFSKIRQAWQNPPEDYVLKKLCGSLLTMSQTGEYNYQRCFQRQDYGAASLCAGELVRAAISAVMWTFGRPVPYYKWSFKALRELEKEKELPLISETLEEILYARDASKTNAEAGEMILELLKAQGLISRDSVSLQTVALELNSRIKDPELRNLSPLAAF